MKKSELKRKTPMKANAFARVERIEAREVSKLQRPKAEPKPKKIKPRKCANRACRGPYMPDPRMPFKNWCSDDCAAVIGMEKVAKQKAKAARQDRAQTRAQKEQNKDYNELAAEAQKEFNTWIRWRDRDQPCICCGRTTTGKVGLHGHMWDAGHYRSVGSAAHLRYHEDNVHKQSVFCNKNQAGNHVQYRIMLIERIGLERVEALECNNTIAKWTHDQLRAIRDEYRARLRKIKKEAA